MTTTGYEANRMRMISEGRHFERCEHGMPAYEGCWACMTQQPRATRRPAARVFRVGEELIAEHKGETVLVTVREVTGYGLTCTDENGKTRFILRDKVAE